MKRALLGLALAGTALFATPHASAAAAYCDKTFLPPCEYCVQPDWTFGPVCASIDLVGPR